MANVQIRCGGCQQVIAVSSEHLGQQVQCPLCQQIVQTPAPHSESGVAAAFDFEESQEARESIFSERKELEDLFDEQPPQLELPPPPMPSTQPSIAGTERFAGPEPFVETVAGPTEAMAPSVVAPDVEPSPPPFASSPVQPVDGIPLHPGGTPPEPEGLPFPETSPGDFAFAQDPSQQESLPWHQDATGESAPEPNQTAGSSIAASVSRQYQSGGLGQTLLTITLILWAVLASVAVGILYARLQEKGEAAKNYLDTMPDIEGNHPGAIKIIDKRNDARAKAAAMKGMEQRSAARAVEERGYDMPNPKNPVSDRFTLALGQTKKVGDLEITPLRVTLDKIQIKHATTQGFQQAPVEKPSAPALKLHLRLKNVSQDLMFHPLDDYFVRRWRYDEYEDGSYPTSNQLPQFGMPYTYLVMLPEPTKGNHGRFYGGPAGRWIPRQKIVLDGRVVRDDNQSLQRALEPNQEMETFICTDPTHRMHNEALAKVVSAAEHEMFWRVRIRRGAVKVGGQRIPACAVIGVKFKVKEIQKIQP